MKKNKKGFSLIELLVVIAIIGVVLVITFPSIMSAYQKTKNSQYSHYENLMREAGKLYIDKGKNDIEELSGVGGCFLIPFNELNKGDLLKEYKTEELDCTNETFLRVERTGEYTYDYLPYLTCKNKEGKKVTNPDESIKLKMCMSYAETPVDPEISATPTTWTKGSVTVSINYHKNNAVREYKVGNGSWQSYVGPISIENNTTVYARGVGYNTRKTNEVNKKITNIDKSKPSVPTYALKYGSATGSNRVNADTWTNQTIWWGSFQASDTGSGVDHYEYSNGCTGSKSGNLGSEYSYSSNVNYKFCIRAVDKVGNESNWSSPIYIKVDKTAPSCSNTGVVAGWTKNNVTITGVCSDSGGSGCTGNVPKSYTNTINVTESPGVVRDNAGNSTTCPVATVQIDKTNPTISFNPNPISIRQGESYDLNTGVTMNDAHSGANRYTMNISSTSSLGVGSHTVTYTVYDNVGNIGSGTRTIQVKSKEPTHYEFANVITSATTWTAPESGYYKFYVIGKGGNGSSGYSTSADGTGGGQGGVSVHLVEMNKGDNAVIQFTGSATVLLVNGKTVTATNGGNGIPVTDTDYSRGTYYIIKGGDGGTGGIGIGGNIANYQGGPGGDAYRIYDGKKLPMSTGKGGYGVLINGEVNTNVSYVTNRAANVGSSGYGQTSGDNGKRGGQTYGNTMGIYTMLGAGGAGGGSGGEADSDSCSSDCSGDPGQGSTGYTGGVVIERGFVPLTDVPTNFNYYATYTSSMTFTAPRNAWYKFYVIGKGGNGLEAGYSTHGGSSGGAGGVSVHAVYMTKGQTATINYNTSYTRLTVNGYNVTAYAGQDGYRWRDGTENYGLKNPGATMLGGYGGTGTYGNIGNYTGGSGQDTYIRYYGDTCPKELGPIGSRCRKYSGGNGGYGIINNITIPYITNTSSPGGEWGGDRNHTGCCDGNPGKAGITYGSINGQATMLGGGGPGGGAGGGSCTCSGDRDGNPGSGSPGYTGGVVVEISG